MSEGNFSNDEERRAFYRRASKKGKKLIFEDETQSEALNIASVFVALMDIKESRSRRMLPSSRQPIDGPLSGLFEWVDLPPENAVRVITQALREGGKGRKLLKAALELKSRAQGTILARKIAGKLTHPKGGWPDKNDEEGWMKLRPDEVEWVKPTKQQVERELEKQYPDLYKMLPKKDGSGGYRLRSDFWNDAGLKDAIDQSRG